MLLALKCTLRHSACRASWAWFGSSLLHLCCRASFWVKVDVKRIEMYLSVAPSPRMRSWIHVLFFFFYNKTESTSTLKSNWEGLHSIYVFCMIWKFSWFFSQGVLHLHIEGGQIEIIYKAMGHSFCFKRNFRLVHCLLVQCALRTAILA